MNEDYETVTLDDGDVERIEVALESLESYDQDDSGLRNWCRVVKARELLSEVEAVKDR